MLSEYFSLEQVQLLDGPFKHAQDLNLKCLLEYDVDRLLATYRKEAGLELKGAIISELERPGWTCYRSLSFGNGYLCSRDW